MKTFKVLFIVPPTWPMQKLIPNMGAHSYKIATSYEDYLKLEDFKFDLLAPQFTPFTPDILVH